MPLKGGRYRVVTTKSGKKVRLHFKGKAEGSRNGEVDEAKNLETGAMHTPEEFMEAKKMMKPKAHGTEMKHVMAPMIGAKRG